MKIVRQLMSKKDETTSTENTASTDDTWKVEASRVFSRIFSWYDGQRTDGDTSDMNSAAARDEHSLNNQFSDLMTAVCEMRCFRDENSDSFDRGIYASKRCVIPSQDVGSYSSGRSSASRRGADIYHTTASISLQQIPPTPITPREPAPSLLPVPSHFVHITAVRCEGALRWARC